MRAHYGLAILGFLAIVAGCSSGGSGGGGVVPQQQQQQRNAADTTTTTVPSATPMTSASPVPTPTKFPTYPGYIHLYSGAVIGQPNMFQPKRGDAWPGTSAGTAGQPIDGMNCNPTMAQNQFHIHAYVGILYNGVQYAVPDSIGMNGYGPVTNGFVNAAHCYYDLHTHDASGMIHNEAASATPNSGTMYTLGNLLDIWDHQLDANGLTNGTAPLSGVTRVFVAARPAINTTYVSGYVENTDPTTWQSIALYSHTAVWIEIGPPYVEASKLPSVRFYTEY